MRPALNLSGLFLKDAPCLGQRVLFSICVEGKELSQRSSAFHPQHSSVLYLGGTRPCQRGSCSDKQRPPGGDEDRPPADPGQGCRSQGWVHFVRIHPGLHLYTGPPFLDLAVLVLERYPRETIIPEIHKDVV